MPGELQFFKGQLFESIPLPRTDLSGRTVIVTGANSGLGLDAAKHLFRLKCSTIILACRNLDKGETAKKDVSSSSIAAEAERHGSQILVWQLDMSSYTSVKAFAEKAAKLERLDAAILNAGVSLKTFSLKEGLEETLTVNVTSTFLLATLLVPILQRSASLTTNAPIPHLSIVGSAVHFWGNTTALEELATKGNILQELSIEKTADMEGRYFLSKLLVMMCVRQLAQTLTKAANASGGSSPLVVVNNVAPGFCKTALFRNEDTMGMRLGMRLIGRESEKGARTLVHGILAGPESHGQYMSEGVIKKCSDWVKSAQGQMISEQLWREVMDVAAGVVPGIQSTI